MSPFPSRQTSSKCTSLDFEDGESRRSRSSSLCALSSQSQKNLAKGVLDLSNVQNNLKCRLEALDRFIHSHRQPHQSILLVHGLELRISTCDFRYLHTHHISRFD